LCEPMVFSAAFGNSEEAGVEVSTPGEDCTVLAGVHCTPFYPQ